MQMVKQVDDKTQMVKPVDDKTLKSSKRLQALKLGDIYKLIQVDQRLDSSDSEYDFENFKKGSFTKSGEPVNPIIQNNILTDEKALIN